MPRRAFTLVELLVVVAVIALLIAILAPALASALTRARVVRGGGNLQQLASAASMHLADNNDHLPQVKLMPNGEPGDGHQAILFPWLFAGGPSAVRVYNAQRIGADRRPLNAYLGEFAHDDTVEVCLDPLDSGTKDPFLRSLAGKNNRAAADSMYTLLGTSYLLNDHALDMIPCPFVNDIFPTLIPSEGGRMPLVETPSRTWMVGQAPIYNYDDGGDAQQRWIDRSVRASLAFVDNHVELAVDVARGVVNTTDRYTFFPQTDWAARFPHASATDH
jgi:prepilin-type N-terminal cleavage/methylation domain-containing protein